MGATWTMRDGTKIAIKDMGTRHIINCLKMLERQAPLHKIGMANFLHDIDAALPEIIHVYGMNTEQVLAGTKYTDLLKELKSRGVEYKNKTDSGEMAVQEKQKDGSLVTYGIDWSNGGDRSAVVKVRKETDGTLHVEEVDYIDFDSSEAVGNGN